MFGINIYTENMAELADFTQDEWGMFMVYLVARMQGNPNPYDETKDRHFWKLAHTVAAQVERQEALRLKNEENGNKGGRPPKQADKPTSETGVNPTQEVGKTQNENWDKPTSETGVNPHTVPYHTKPYNTKPNESSSRARSEPAPAENAPAKPADKNIKSRPAGKQRASPTLSEAQAYFAACKLSGSATAFFEYNTSHGWTDAQGKPIVDWQALARLWSEREAQYAPRASARGQPASGIEYTDGTDLDAFLGAKGRTRSG
jgi:hypothetical protein